MSLTTPLVRLRILPALLPVDGINADIRVSPDGLYLQKKVGLGAWENLVAIADLQGPIGPETEMRSNGSYVQYRPKGSNDTAWRDLYALSDLGGAGGGGSGGPVAFSEITGKPTTLGGYGITDGATQTELTNGLASKANSTHSHAINDVSGLSSAIQGIANNINDFKATKGQPGGLAPLGPDGILDPAIIPAPTAPNVKDKLTWYVSDLNIPVNDPNRDDRQKLMDLAATVIAAGGGRVVVDVPVRVSAAWRWENAKDIEIMGRGAGSLEIIVNSSAPAVAGIRFVSCERYHLHDLRIFADPSATRDSVGFCTDSYLCKHGRIERIHADHTLTGPWHGTCDYVWVSDCVVTNTKADGIHFTFGTRYFHCLNNVVANPRDDFIAVGSASTTTGNPGYQTTMGVIQGNICRDGAAGGGAGIIVYEAVNVVIADNILSETGTMAIGVVGLPEEPGVKSQRITIRGNRINKPGQSVYVLNNPALGANSFQAGSGIFVNDANDVVVADNFIFDGDSPNQGANKSGIMIANVARCELRDNRIYGGYHHGICGYGTVEDLDLIDNLVDNVKNNGIDLATFNPNIIGYTTLDSNRLRRVGQSSGLPIQIGTQGGGVMVLKDNIAYEGQASSIGTNESRHIIARNNYPALPQEPASGGSYPRNPEFDSIRIVPGGRTADGGPEIGTFVVGPSGAARYYDGQFYAARRFVVE